jgi:hypothetical protein
LSSTKAATQGSELPTPPAAGDLDQQALREALAPLQARFESDEQFEDVVRLLMESGRRAAVRNMLRVSLMRAQDIFALFGEIDAAIAATGGTLASQRKPDEEIAAPSATARRPDESPLPARATLPAKGVARRRPDNPEEESGAFDEVVQRVGDRQEPALQELAARALFNKGVRLGRLRRREEEIVVYDEMMRRFGKSQAPGLRDLMATAKRRLDRLRIGDSEASAPADPQGAQDAS